MVSFIIQHGETDMNRNKLLYHFQILQIVDIVLYIIIYIVMLNDRTGSFFELDWVVLGTKHLSEIVHAQAQNLLG